MKYDWVPMQRISLFIFNFDIFKFIYPKWVFATQTGICYENGYLLPNVYHAINSLKCTKMTTDHRHLVLLIINLLFSVNKLIRWRMTRVMSKSSQCHNFEKLKLTHLFKSCWLLVQNIDLLVKISFEQT